MGTTGPAAGIRYYCVLILLLCASSASAQYITVYGSPTYTPGVGGFQEGDLEVVPVSSINTAGMAVSFANKYDGTGTSKGNRAVRWNASSAIELGNLGTDTSGFTQAYAFAIDTAGIAVGYAYKYDGLGTLRGDRAVRWDASGTVATELGNIGTDTSGVTHVLAYTINTAGAAAGYAYKYDPSGTNKGYRAVRWEPSGTAATELGNLGTDTSGYTQAEAHAINTAGTAIGQGYKYDGSGTNIGLRAARWAAPGTAATELGNLGTDTGGYTFAYAWAINDGAVGVGSAYKYDGAGTLKGYRAVRWAASGTAATELGNLGTNTSGSTTAHAVAINTAGTALGYANKYDSAGTNKGSRAVRWDASGTAATELGSLGTNTSGRTDAFAVAINDGGYAVGYAEKYDSLGNDLGQRAVYWSLDNLAVDLNTLIDPSSGWTLQEAKAISDTGWIAGYGLFDPDGPSGQAAYTRLFSMYVPATAVPEPSSVALLAMLGTLALRRRLTAAPA
jgi:hypothetical protein